MLPSLFGKSKCHTNREGQSLVGQVNKFSCKTKLAFTTNVGIPFPVLKKQLNKHFLTISYLFSIPKNCSNLKFHCPLEVLHLEKLEKIFFQVGKKIVLLGKIFFLVGNFFSHFSTRKDRKS